MDSYNQNYHHRNVHCLFLKKCAGWHGRPNKSKTINRVITNCEQIQFFFHELKHLLQFVELFPTNSTLSILKVCNISYKLSVRDVLIHSFPTSVSKNSGCDVAMSISDSFITIAVVYFHFWVCCFICIAFGVFVQVRGNRWITMFNGTRQL